MDPSDEEEEAMANGNSRGRVLYSASLRMLDPINNLTASFSSTFSFQISAPPNSSLTSAPLYMGDGMAFVISPDNSTLGHYGKWLGAFTLESSPSNNHTFAVEFDTWLNPDVGDPSSNHVGLDVGSIWSSFSRNASDAGVVLHSGSVVHAWIDYDGVAESIQVRLSPHAFRPPEALIDVSLSLSSIFHEFMYVGFSASTGSSTEMHTLLSWSFGVWGLADILATQSPSSKSRNSRTVIVGFLMSAIAFSLLLGILCWRLWRARIRVRYFRRAAEYEHRNWAAVNGYTYKMLFAATSGFSEKERLGKRGFGSFFRGVLSETGMAVAVKKVCEYREEGAERFLKEASLLSSLHHRNLVQLLGWARDTQGILLVYEFLPFAGLDGFLFDSKHEVLSWADRYKIVAGIAAALSYLHEGCFGIQDTPRYVTHRNVKASNVLVDHDFNAKLGDYGLASVLDHSKVAGTFGYIAPEVVENGRCTPMTDVFSFGAVALEVACGRRALEGSMGSGKAVLVDYVWGLEREERIVDAADPRLEGCFDAEEMRRLLHVGLWCSHPHPTARPSMKAVEQILAGHASLPPLLPISDHRSHALNISIERLLAE